MSFNAESSSDSALDSEKLSDQFTNVECVQPYETSQACETSYERENLSDKVLMPYSLQKIFANPSTTFKSDCHSSPESSLNASDESYLPLTSAVKDKSTSKNMLCKHFSASPRMNISPTPSSNVSTMSSSCSFPSLLETSEGRPSSHSDTERSQTSFRAQRERRFSDSNSNSSFIITSSSTETNSPRESWYYYDLRMRPGESFRVNDIADTLLEFFQQLNRSAEPTPPPSYDTTIGMDISSSTSSSILIPVESAIDMFPEEGDSLPATPSDVCCDSSPPPYSEYDEPPAYEEIDEHDYQNIYEIINNLESDVTTDSHLAIYGQPTDPSDFVLEPHFGPQNRSGFNFGLTGRPAMRWNVHSGVERWARAPSLGWNRI